MYDTTIELYKKSHDFGNFELHFVEFSLASLNSVSSFNILNIPLAFFVYLQVFYGDFYHHNHLSSFFHLYALDASLLLLPLMLIFNVPRPSSCSDFFARFLVGILLCDFYILFARPFTVYVLQLTWACS